jgi:hypothetical protein
LIPEENIGIFIVTNSFNGIHDKFISQFFDRYFPATQPKIDAAKLSSQQLTKYTGTFRDMEYPRQTKFSTSQTFIQHLFNRATSFGYCGS